MEFLLFSDFHAHNFKNYAKQETTDLQANATFNSRLLDSLNALYEVVQYAHKNGIKNIIFGGDLFHVRGGVPTDAFNLVFDYIASESALNWLMIPGNHDYADREGYVHALQPFGNLPNVQLVDWSAYENNDKFVYLDGGYIHCVPYTDNLEKAKEALSEVPPENCVLLAHLGIQGAVVGSDYVLYNDSDIQVKDVGKELYRCCFFGHFHEHQQVFRNGYYIGALTQHNWGDAGGRRGFVHARIGPERNSIKHIETNAPKFIKIKDGAKPVYRKGDFLKYVGSDLLEEDAVKLLEERFGDAGSFEVSSADEEKAKNINLDVQSLDAMEVLQPWMLAHDKSEDKELLDLGKRLLAEAREDEL